MYENNWLCGGRPGYWTRCSTTTISWTRKHDVGFYFCSGESKSFSSSIGSWEKDDPFKNAWNVERTLRDFKRIGGRNETLLWKRRTAPELLNGFVGDSDSVALDCRLSSAKPDAERNFARACGTQTLHAKLLSFQIAERIEHRLGYLWQLFH